MKEIKFVKYNKTRKKQFQIKTTILEEEKIRYVEKSALSVEGISHIWSFATKYDGLKDQNPNLHMVKPQISDDGVTARFAYLDGETLAEQLGSKIQNGIAPVIAIKAEMERVYQVSAEYLTPFLITPEFMKVFGEAQELTEKTTEQNPIFTLHDQAYTISNMDALFENMLMTKDGIFCLDYEWVFDFPIPIHFVQYRTLYYFYDRYASLMQYSSLDDFLAEFDITPEMAFVYREMEKGFQSYVHGENQIIYLENFMKETIGVEEMADIERNLALAKERIGQLKAENTQQEATIRKIQEVHRLTNNHVTNLEIIIGNLRRENVEQSKTLAYLNRHEALIYKVWRRSKNKINQVFPKDTKRRKVLVYVKNTMIHPISHLKLYGTKEGRNRIYGDFKIGKEYLTRGKLVFPSQETPLVSIVIPVYNQIEYTYACLGSILEYTKDVSYEIIIADDVSTDATLQLSQFAESISISRNEVNQGFLKNCNQAAKRAKGQYIMFLNNDTQVTEGWLSSLVRLIESDPMIGMVGSKLVYPDGRLQEAGGIIWSDGSGWNYGRLENPDRSEYNYVKDVDYISGAAILLSAKLWNQIGGFDVRFAPAYYEDTDLAFEVRKAGYRVVYQPLSKVIHFEGISNGTDVQGEGLKRYQAVNAEKFREKWKYELAVQFTNNGNPDPFRARERSKRKLMVLVIDHYVPTFDKDAGSKSTFQQLCMFLSKGFSVKFLGDNFLHEEPYSTTLQQMGIEILYGSEYQSGIWTWLKDHGDDLEFIYMNRPHIAVNYINYIKEHTKCKVMFYGHDLHWLREKREYELTGNEEKKQNSDYWKSIETTLMHQVDMTYYPSYIEENIMKELDPKLNIKHIPVYAYQTFLPEIGQDFEKREHLLFVGGFAHPPNTDAVLWFVKDIYPKIREQVSADFIIVGSKVPDEVKILGDTVEGIQVRGFVSDEELVQLYASSRVVVVPLRFGAGVKGKVIEALYHGLPTVTTPIGAEGIEAVKEVLVIQGQADAFAKAVVDLYQNPGLCKEYSDKTQVYIREYYSVDTIWNTIKDDFTPQTR